MWSIDHRTKRGASPSEMPIMSMSAITLQDKDTFCPCVPASLFFASFLSSLLNVQTERDWDDWSATFATTVVRLSGVNHAVSDRVETVAWLQRRQCELAFIAKSYSGVPFPRINIVCTQNFLKCVSSRQWKLLPSWKGISIHNHT